MYKSCSNAVCYSPDRIPALCSLSYCGHCKHVLNLKAKSTSNSNAHFIDWLQNEVLHLKHPFQEAQHKYDEQCKQVQALKSQRSQRADRLATAEMSRPHKAAPDFPTQQQPAQQPMPPASSGMCLQLSLPYPMLCHTTTHVVAADLSDKRHLPALPLQLQEL